ncbi:short-chain dehydrogenase/reductase family 16C member 6 [Aethina tumida]|uniref:short-chain dehydrogenase/reductase family 16C member 6 n=1 Tax=Aethina tumida TaxID=116153 RepID=UPI00096B3C85|nr:short-chain dehydrogenase/reductase family 16C member 6 [Aethina tumida]XP_019871768.1 short-chain dehydrogenase/reductase family 16C member 6 [Aethina tumida]
MTQTYMQYLNNLIYKSVVWTGQLIYIWALWTWQVTTDIVNRIIEMTILCTLAIYYITEAVILTFTPSFLRAQKSLKGKVVLVTGGAGGVGQELALRLARCKARVVVWDNNEKAMEKVRDKIEADGFKIYTYLVDVSDREDVYKAADQVKADLGPIDILINNAGVVCGQPLLDIPDYMIEKTYKVNILSHYWTVKAFLPDMMKKRKGHIVTVGSLTGMLGTYKCTDYAATKHATIGFHESLLVELKTHGYDRINMTLVCPYFINTGMFDGCKPRNMSMLEPKDVAKRIITAIRREEVFVTMPSFSRFILPLKNYVPAKLGWAFMYRVIQGPQSMMGMRNFHEVEAA